MLIWLKSAFMPVIRRVLDGGLVRYLVGCSEPLLQHIHEEKVSRPRIVCFGAPRQNVIVKQYATMALFPAPGNIT